jgi:hypothetical protein
MRHFLIPAAAATLVALTACHPQGGQAPTAGTSNGTTDTSNAGGAPGTATNNAGVATPNGTPPATLPTDPNAASAAAGADVASSVAR